MPWSQIFSDPYKSQKIQLLLPVCGTLPGSLTFHNIQKKNITVKWCCVSVSWYEVVYQPVQLDCFVFQPVQLTINYVVIQPVQLGLSRYSYVVVCFSGSARTARLYCFSQIGCFSQYGCFSKYIWLVLHSHLPGITAADYVSTPGSSLCKTLNLSSAYETIQWTSGWWQVRWS